MAPSASPKLVSPLLLLTIVTAMIIGMMKNIEASWCILQEGLDFACAQGADCTPIQSGGTCFKPDTVQSHASYAFNSYYQRKNQDPPSCDFGDAANITTIDPSYGSCVYPSTPSTGGGANASTTTDPNN
ncbi:hypothetical protein VNO77_01220 [Canavalia gladiata]|uniref:X8 domain-containing protein n=1 Tax=Canavalia gladiata TaxID=3824 RepID=A0AAN9R4S0_CANGL